MIMPFNKAVGRPEDVDPDPDRRGDLPEAEFAAQPAGTRRHQPDTDARRSGRDAWQLDREDVLLRYE